MKERGIRRVPRARGRWAYQVSYRAGGERHYETAPTLHEARALRTQRLREVANGTWVAPADRGTHTLRGYADVWLRLRQGQGVRGVDDMSTHLDRHVLPTLGAMRLHEIRPRHVAALIDQLRAGHLSAKSVRNVHGTLRAMLEHARFEELIADNPARLPRGRLPRPGRTVQPRYSREEVVTLCTDERIAEHRRVFYALMAFTGMRCGEASGRRWRDYDAAAKPLGSLRCHTQYLDQPLKTSEDEWTAERMIPVHAELARVLATWRLRGFVEIYGVHPRATDWIVADPRTNEPRTQNQAHKALRRDCALVGIEPRGTHAFRHAFVSLARSDGARKDVLERVTHNARGEIVDAYTSFEWAALCEAVSALQVDLRRGASVTAIARKR